MANKSHPRKFEKSRPNASVIASVDASVIASVNASVKRWRIRQRLICVEALQGVYFLGVAMIRPLAEKALFLGIFSGKLGRCKHEHIGY